MSENISLNRGGNLALASGALANGTTAGTVKTTATIPFTIDGVFYSKAATDNLSIAFAGPSIYSAPANGSFTGGANGSTRLYGLYLDSGGNLSVDLGPVVDSAELAAGRAPLQWPDNKKGLCFIGALRIAVTAGTTFIPGTTALNAAGVTASYYNCANAPSAPLLS